MEQSMEVCKEAAAFTARNLSKHDHFKQLLIFLTISLVIMSLVQYIGQTTLPRLPHGPGTSHNTDTIFYS